MITTDVMQELSMRDFHYLPYLGSLLPIQMSRVAHNHIAQGRADKFNWPLWGSITTVLFLFNHLQLRGLAAGIWDADRELAVLDWESPERQGLPALDLIYFLSYLVCFPDGTRRPDGA